MTLRSRFFAVSVALCAAAGLGCFSPDAHACGGLFCSSANPVNQAAERIVFATNDDGTVTAAIEILYQGPSEKFAWVLPVPAAKVDVAVSSKQAFDALQQASNPQYSLQTSFDPSCPSPPLTATGGLAGSAGPPSAAEGDAASPVEVVASGNVGPYDYTQIQVNPDDADPAQAAIDWFTENGYDVGALGPDVLRPYLEQDMNLLAFKLTKGNDTGSIRPVLLNYPGERPVIPIRPTAVAANDDMGILVWVLGSGRAVPTTYFDLQLNDAHINWFSPNATYNDVVSRAADEAGGKGFVTEESGPAGDFAQTIFPDWKEEQFTELRTANFSSMEEFLQMAQSVAQSHFYPSITGFGGPLGDAAVSIGQNQYDGFMDVLSDPDIVPLRDGATPEQLNGCVACYFQQDVAVQNDLYPSTPYDPATDPLLDMDVPAFLDAMEAKVIEPLRATRALFENNAHVTRLYTTMSADEMDIDPEFDLNPELEDVSNVHTATRVLQCNGDDWTVRLPDGIEIQGNGSTWPVALDDEEMPFNVRVLQLSTTGEGDVVMDNTDLVLTRLSDLGLSDVVPDVTPGSDPATPVDATGPSGPGSVDLQNPDGVDETTPGATPMTPSDSTTSNDSTTPNDPSSTDGSSGDAQVVDGNKGTDSQLNDAMEAKTSSGGCAIRAPSGGRPTAPWALLSLPLGFALARRRRARR
jgi:hypothetical protein